MPEKIALIHTVLSVIPEFTRLSSEIMPGVKPLHVLDELVLEHVSQNERVNADDTERLRDHITAAEQVGARAVLVTCTMLSACVDEIRPTAGIPIIKIDEAVVEEAVARGQTIGLLATNPDTLEPSSRMLYDEAARTGRSIHVVPALAEHAFDAIRSGDTLTHDRMVKDAIFELSPGVEVLVLAQASMARVLNLIPQGERVVPILSSPHLALERVRQAIAAQLSSPAS